MKKVVSLIVLSVYVLSIVFVGLFGMKILAANEIIYAQSVEFTNTDIRKNKDDELYIVIRNYKKGTKYQLEWKVLPATATDTSVKFSHTPDSENIISEEGLVTFNADISFTVTIVCKDGSNKSQEVQFIVLYT